MTHTDSIGLKHHDGPSLERIEQLRKMRLKPFRQETGLGMGDSEEDDRGAVRIRQREEAGEVQIHGDHHAALLSGSFE